jgi:hypothetical protein
VPPPSSSDDPDAGEPDCDGPDAGGGDAARAAYGLGIDDDTIVKAVGAELTRVRRSLGWSRRILMSRLRDELGVDIPVNTYACYEQALRPCPIPRLVLFCRAMGVDPSEVLGLALQRAQVDLHHRGVRMDLLMVLAAQEPDEKLGLLQRWARHRLDNTGDGVARMEWAVLQELAVFLGVTGKEMVAWLLRFTPEQAPQRTRPVGEPADH